MGKQQNHVETVQKTLSLSKGVCVYLEELVTLNLYGKNPTEAAARLVEKQIESLIEKGILKKRKFQNRKK
jgi:hypothetical protein